MIAQDFRDKCIPRKHLSVGSTALTKNSNKYKNSACCGLPPGSASGEETVQLVASKSFIGHIVYWYCLAAAVIGEEIYK